MKSSSLIMTSVRLGKDLHESLRQIAFNRRVSLHSLLIEGAKLAVQKYQQEINATHAGSTSFVQNGERNARNNSAAA